MCGSAFKDKYLQKFEIKNRFKNWFELDEKNSNSKTENYLIPKFNIKFKNQGDTKKNEILKKITCGWIKWKED